MQPKEISTIQLSYLNGRNPIFDISKDGLGRALHQSGLPPADIILDNVYTPTDWPKLGKYKKNPPTVTLYSEELVRNVEYYTRRLREKLTGREIPIPPVKKLSRANHQFLSQVYSGKYDTHGFVDTSRVGKYIELAKKNFEGMAKVKTGESKGQVREYSTQEAKERAEKFFTKLVSYNMENQIAFVLAHEHGHAYSPDFVPLTMKERIIDVAKPVMLFIPEMIAAENINRVFPTPAIIPYILLGIAAFSTIELIIIKAASNNSKREKKKILQWRIASETEADEEGHRHADAFKQAVQIDRKNLRERLFKSE